ncbi:hypothetical protein M1O53_02975 [Dehalococcoidia bacterium]|nr:hypothetical protein [Dehalococcoidia bacterium]MCL0093926.1 hypothetical protein [Dehalococcoidia bacterium]
MLKKTINRVHRNERGITGLETAIILIAFVVVASVFAYTVLTAGLFASERGREAVHAGLEGVRSTLEPRGSTIAYADRRQLDPPVNIDTDGTPGLQATDTLAVARISFTVSSSLGGEPIDVTPPFNVTAGTLTPADPANNVVRIAYIDSNIFIPDAAWTVEFIGEHTPDDYLLEDDEKAIITVWLVDFTGGIYHLGTADDPFITNADHLVGTDHTFMLEVKPPVGAVLSMERTTPARLDVVMNLR